MTKRIIFFVACISLVFWAISCKHKPFPVPAGPTDTTTTTYGNYPPEVGKIIIQRCVDGCHDAAHYKTDASGLLLDTWDHLFNGGDHGAVVIPFSSAYSSLLHYINVDPSLGPMILPTMPDNRNPPYNRPPLSKEEYTIIKKWIDEGAKDKDGNIPFASNAETRQKIYITTQGCNLVAVVDAERKVVMRYIDTKQGDDKSPHTVRVSPDGKYAYVCFAAGYNFQKINTTTDKVEGMINLNQYAPTVPVATNWNAFSISEDGKQIAVTDFSGAGRLTLFNTTTLKNPTAYIDPILKYPHGVAASKDFNSFYVTSQYGNVVHKIYPATPSQNKQIAIDSHPPTLSSDTTYKGPNPHEVLMSPDGSKIFITCQGTNEIRVMSTGNDSIIAVIPVGARPQEMAISKIRPYLFVTCIDAVPYSRSLVYKGVVDVINYNTNTFITRISATASFAQPHGIAVDDLNGVIYVSSRNQDPSGPLPHHTSDCGGRNGFFQAIDMESHKPVSVKHELTPDPYGADVRFK